MVVGCEGLELSSGKLINEEERGRGIDTSGF